MLPLIGSIISAGSSFLGGLLGQQNAADNREASMWTNLMNLNEQRRVNEENRAFAREINSENLSAAERTNLANIHAAADINRATIADKDLDRQLQREFAQSGIRWRVDDARAAGIHPIYALGGPGASYSPGAISLVSPSRVTPLSSVGAASQAYAASPPPVTGNNIGSSLASMGQDIGRALTATQTAVQRDAAFEQTSRDLWLQNATLKNELLASQIAKLKGQVGPPMQSVPEADKPEERKQLFMGGKIKTDPNWTNAQDFEDRWGEISDWTVGPYIMYKDFVANTGGVAPFVEGKMKSWIEKLEDYNRKVGNKPVLQFKNWR